MEILFGDSGACVGCDCEVSEGTFSSELGRFFYKVEMLDTEMITIKDACDRYVPFDYEHIPALILALQTVLQRTEGAIAQYDEVTNYFKEQKIAV